MAAFEVHRRAVVGGGLVHGDPEPYPLVGRDRPVLVVLVPLEPLVRVDHEQVGRYAHLRRAAALGEDVAHGGVVVEVGETPVRLPYVPLDVIVQAGGRAGEGPEVGVGHLVRRGAPEVLDPIGVEDALDQHDAVLLEGEYLILGEVVLLGGGDTGDYAVG